MPEEINRLVTDTLADFLWTPSPDGDENLAKEGIPSNKVQCVGNIMIDSLEMMRVKIENLSVYRDWNLAKGQYGLITLHRPSNVDDPDALARLCHTLMRVSEKLPLVFPIHPRTRKNLQVNGLYQDLEEAKGILLREPISYINFMNLVFNCGLIITDSGGIQEETTYLGIPCLTLRPNTERPITVTQGTNQLCRISELETLVDQVLSGNGKKGSIPDLWDGKTAHRVVEEIKKITAPPEILAYTH